MKDSLLKLAKPVMLVQKAKKFIGKEEDGNYYYELAFTTGEELISFTGGVALDDMKLMKWYDLALNYVNGKLKIVDFLEVGVNDKK